MAIDRTTEVTEAHGTDYRTLFDRDYLGHFDLPPDRDVVVTIAKVVGGQLTGNMGKKSKKPIIYFEGKEKGLICNKTNGKTIAKLYGPIVEQWKGKRIALYVGQTHDPSGEQETIACIRVRPTVPEAKASRKRQPGED